MLRNILTCSAAIVMLCNSGPLLAKYSPEEQAEHAPFDYPYVLINGTPEVHQDADRMGSRPWHPGYPTGYYAEPNQKIHYAVNCANHKDNVTPQLQIGTWDRYKEKPEPDRFTLAQNVNTSITAGNKGGIIYAYAPMGKYTIGANCRLTFVDATPMPYYRLGTTTNAAWREMLANYPTPDVVFESERAIIVASRESALRYINEDQDKVLQTIDKIINAQDDIAMLTEDAIFNFTSSKSLYKLLITETDDPDVHAYARSYGTVYNKNLMGQLLTVQGLVNEGWVAYHELGHMHEIQAWKWSGINEVQVNIFALAAEREMGISPSRWMTVANSWPRAKEFLNKTAAQKDFNQDSALGNEGKLMMFHQLWLAYGDNFYRTLLRHYRVSSPDLPNDADRINSFIVKASIYSGYNLASFFTTWGLMPKDPNAYNSLLAELDALRLPDTKIDPYTLTDLAG